MVVFIGIFKINNWDSLRFQFGPMVADIFVINAITWLSGINSLIICFGRISSTTVGGSHIYQDITLPNSYTVTNYKVFITNFRNNRWDYDIHYADAYGIKTVNTIYVECKGLNNGQFIDGFSWLTIGY